MKQLLLAGGGHAHVQVLQALAQAPMPGVQATLVTPYARQMYSGMVPGLVAGHYRAAQCAIALAPLAQSAGAHLIETALVGLDAKARVATLADGRTLAYDALSLDVGAVMERTAIPGAREHALWVRPIEQFVQWLTPVFEIALERALDFVVIGGGAAGLELSMALQWRLQQLSGGVERSRVTLVAGCLTASRPEGKS